MVLHTLGGFLGTGIVAGGYISQLARLVRTQGADGVSGRAYLIWAVASGLLLVVGSKNVELRECRLLWTLGMKQNSLGTPADLHNRSGQSGTASSERILGRRKSHPAGAVASALASFRSGENDARRDRETTRAQGSGPSSLRGQTRHHSGLVSKADRTEVRWIQAPKLSRQAANRSEVGISHYPDGSGE